MAWLGGRMVTKTKQSAKTGPCTTQPSSLIALPSTLEPTDALSVNVTSVTSPNTVLPINTDNCPCGISDHNVENIDCSKCGRYWHTSCLSMVGISKDSINKMVNYLCPFCYVVVVLDIN